MYRTNPEHSAFGTTVASSFDRKKSTIPLIKEVTCEQVWKPWIRFVKRAKRRPRRSAVFECCWSRRGRNYRATYIELLLKQPYCKDKFLVERSIAKRQTADEYLKELEKAGILRSEKGGRKNLYLNVRLDDLLSGTPPKHDDKIDR